MYLKLKHLLACKENLFKNQNFKKKNKEHKEQNKNKEQKIRYSV